MQNQIKSEALIAIQQVHIVKAYDSDLLENQVNHLLFTKFKGIDVNLHFSLVGEYIDGKKYVQCAITYYVYKKDAELAVM